MTSYTRLGLMTEWELQTTWQACQYGRGPFNAADVYQEMVSRQLARTRTPLDLGGATIGMYEQPDGSIKFGP